MNCIYCDNKKLYHLKSGQVKCSRCKKKFSLNKIKKDLALIEAFCEDLTANETAHRTNLNYVTITNRFKLFRVLIANYLEDKYRDKNVIEYDEYTYLPQSKKRVKENIFDAHNFITFHFEDQVFNLLMPSLHVYKKQFLDDAAEEAYFKEFSKYMMLNKISKTQKRENIITKFWLYFEDSILKYKGIENKNFFIYLKEIEFKFNYKKTKQKEILKALYYA
ncbi:transposase [Sulfurimonas sp.]|uniref:transposase n=1 Tax=Sulfurimonas sp. TaxID=2022749 RepID=UPI002B46B1DC|nr:transposase [Sulfurimonas sp.]